jgi:hypothetical protein
VPTDLVGQRLDGAESELDGNGIAYTPIGGGAFGTIVKSNRSDETGRRSAHALHRASVSSFAITPAAEVDPASHN